MHCADLPHRPYLQAMPSLANTLSHRFTYSRTHLYARALQCMRTHPCRNPSLYTHNCTCVQVRESSSTPRALLIDALIHPRVFPLADSSPRTALFAHVFARAFIWSHSCALFLALAHSILEHRSCSCVLSSLHLRGTSPHVRKVNAQRHR